MKVLVCGSRDNGQAAPVGSVLDAFHRATPITALIEGGARGVDRLAREWAQSRGVPVETFAADWHRYGPAAGPIRNRRMIVEGEPEVVIAFPGGKGTANMVKEARRAHLEVLVIAALGPTRDATARSANTQASVAPSEGTANE